MGFDGVATRVAADRAGGVVVLGTFVSTATLGATTLEALGDEDVFVAAFDGDGASRWAVSLGTAGRDHADGLTVLPDGRVVVAWTTGNINGELMGTMLSSDGAELQSRRFGEGRHHDVASDEHGSVVIAGWMRGPSQVPAIAPTETDLFIASLDAELNLRWVDTIGGLSGMSTTHLDVDGDVFTWAGAFDGSPTFDPMPTNDDDVFLARYSGAGTLVSQAVVRLPGRQTVTGVASGASIRVVGSIDQETSFVGPALTAAGDSTAYAASFSSSLDAEWATASDIGNSIYLRAVGAVQTTTILHDVVRPGAREIVVLDRLGSERETIPLVGDVTAFDIVEDGCVFVVGKVRGKATLGATVLEPHHEVSNAFLYARPAG